MKTNLDLSNFNLSDEDKNTINAYFRVVKERDVERAFIVGFFPYAGERIALKLGLRQHGFGNSIYYKNDKKRIIFVYCEGDLNLTIFTDTERYLQEVKETEHFYKG